MQTFSSLLCFHNYKTDEWMFHEHDDVFSVESEVPPLYTTEYRNVFYICSTYEHAGHLMTFQSCPVNTIYGWISKTDGPNADMRTIADNPLVGYADKYKDASKYYQDDDWRLRTCYSCDFNAPFSYGFNGKECASCDQIEQSIASADDYVQHFFGISCRGEEVVIKQEEVRPTDPDGNPSQQSQVQANVVTPDTDEEEGSMTTIIIVVVLVVVIGAVFLFYWFYLKPRFQAQHNTERRNSDTSKRRASDASNGTRRNSKTKKATPEPRPSSVGLTSKPKKADDVDNSNIGAQQQNNSQMSNDFKTGNKNFDADDF